MIWMIDFTRAFRPFKKLEDPGKLDRISRRLYNDLRDLNEDDVKRELGRYLYKPEIRGLLARLAQSHQPLPRSRGFPHPSQRSIPSLTQPEIILLR